MCVPGSLAKGVHRRSPDYSFAGNYADTVMVLTARCFDPETGECIVNDHEGTCVQTSADLCVRGGWEQLVMAIDACRAPKTQGMEAILADATVADAVVAVAKWDWRGGLQVPFIFATVLSRELARYAMGQ